MNRPIVVLDTETTAPRGAPHLLELGAVRVVEGEVVDRFDTLVRPQVPIDPEATEVHGIEGADVAAAPPTAEALADFVDWLGDDWMAAHDAPKDARVLAFELTRARLPLPTAPLLDTLRLARKLLPEAGDHRLETLSALLELETDVHHRALPDAVTTFKVLEACAERLADSAGAPGAERLLAEAGRVPTTIAGHAPEPGRMKPRWRPLVSACGSGATLTLLYGSGDEPPVELPVVPQLLYSAQKKGYLEAECLNSGLVKTYRLDRIHKVLAR
jgi:DNA polymerase III epsilon subunit family exonuclease